MEWLHTVLMFGVFGGTRGLGIETVRFPYLLTNLLALLL